MRAGEDSHHPKGKGEEKRSLRSVDGVEKKKG
jgi:hypothetical protein